MLEDCAVLEHAQSSALYQTCPLFQTEFSWMIFDFLSFTSSTLNRFDTYKADILPDAAKWRILDYEVVHPNCSA